MEIFRDNPVTLALGVQGATEVTAVVVRDGVEIHTAEGNTVPLPFKVYGYDGNFQVRWEFFVPGDLLLHTRYEAHDVVTPLVDMGFATDGVFTDAELEDIDAERLVRRIIQNYCGQSFGYSYNSRTVQGSGGRVLSLPDRLINLTGVSMNVYPYDHVPYGSIDISSDGWSLVTGAGAQYYTVKEAPPEDAIISSNGVIVAPGYTRNWDANRTYVITGSWGYEGVPQEISEAARLLIEDYKCPEDSYRNKFIANMRSADWRIEFDPRTWSGTGNVKADQLLAPFLRSGLGIV